MEIFFLYDKLDKQLLNVNYLSLFSPYIKLEALKKINSSKSIKRIVVAWHKEDILKGVSDLELYEYCKEHNIELYRNPRIHLKVLWDGDQNIVLGSANITNKGLGFVENSNFELSVNLNQVSYEIKNYLNMIVSNSVLITDDIYNQILHQLDIENTLYPKLGDFEIIEKNDDYFLLSQLPQSYSPEYLLAVVKSQGNLNDLDNRCMENDLKTYRILYQSDEQFLNDLSNAFLSHPFIKKFSQHIESLGSLRYGGVVRWIQENCKEVPIPRSFELKQDGVVNILYRWLCYFDKTFEVIRPNHSEVIQKKASF